MGHFMSLSSGLETMSSHVRQRTYSQRNQIFPPVEWQQLSEGQNGQEEAGLDLSPLTDPHRPADALTSDPELGSTFFRAGTLPLLLIPLWDDNV